MRVVFAFVLFSLAFVCSAQSQGCCTPDVWQGDISGFSRDLNLYWYEYTYYNWYQKSIRADIYENYDNKELVYSVLELFNAGQIYIIHPDGSCKYEETTSPGTQACVPSGGHRFPATIGGNLQTDLFAFTSPKGSNITEFAMTRSSCYPIFGMLLERQEQIFLGDWEITYFNLYGEIFDPFVFEAPLNCQLVQPGTILAFEKERLARKAHEGNKQGAAHFPGRSHILPNLSH
mmetsp:Transcript_10088/g.15942  ORF Transcript_10088/g.15942 Transcript_10088/m.15942 type:complete len:232 (-) Transcript_10088:12-707(-)